MHIFSHSVQTLHLVVQWRRNKNVEIFSLRRHRHRSNEESRFQLSVSHSFRDYVDVFYQFYHRQNASPLADDDDDDDGVPSGMCIVQWMCVWNWIRTNEEQQKSVWTNRFNSKGKREKFECNASLNVTRMMGKAIIRVRRAMTNRESTQFVWMWKRTW